MPGAYALPLIYDIAFGDRNFAGEVDFLLQAGEKHLGRPIASAIELACGPAYHCREIARRGILSEGQDLSEEMVEYANQLIAYEGLAAKVYQSDMRRWHAPRKYDLACCMLVSFAHLLTNDDIVDHLNCVAELLTEGGIYIISHAHPRDFYGSGEPEVERTWRAERNGVLVETDWGGGSQSFDPITEVDELTITYTVTAEGHTDTFQSMERLRRLSYQTFLALVKLSGRFEIAAMLGDFDMNIPLQSQEAVRMVALLRRI